MQKRKIHECDWKGCRKRKGVELVEIIINGQLKDNLADNFGYLCPDHRAVMTARLVFADIVKG